MLGDIAPIESDQKILKNSDKEINNEICTHISYFAYLLLYLHPTLQNRLRQAHLGEQAPLLSYFQAVLDMKKADIPLHSKLLDYYGMIDAGHILC